jgi:hypothetical protein
MTAPHLPVINSSEVSLGDVSELLITPVGPDDGTQS